MITKKKSDLKQAMQQVFYVSPLCGDDRKPNGQVRIGEILRHKNPNFVNSHEDAKKYNIDEIARDFSRMTHENLFQRLAFAQFPSLEGAHEFVEGQKKNWVGNVEVIEDLLGEEIVLPYDLLDTESTLYSVKVSSGSERAPIDHMQNKLSEEFERHNGRDMIGFVSLEPLSIKQQQIVPDQDVITGVVKMSHTLERDGSLDTAWIEGAIVEEGVIRYVGTIHYGDEASFFLDRADALEYVQKMLAPDGNPPQSAGEKLVAPGF